MLEFILSVILGLIIYKYVFQANIKIGDDYINNRIKEIECGVEKTARSNELTDPISGYVSVPTGYWYHLKEIAINRNSLCGKYLVQPQGHMVGTMTIPPLCYYADPSDVLYGTVEHLKDKEWQEDNEGYYTTVEENQLNYNLFEYHPVRCPICGKEVVYEAPKHPNTKAAINTSVASDSVSRYCEDCRNLLEHGVDETYFPFYIDTISKTLVKSSDKEKFEFYMERVRNAKLYDQHLKEVPYQEADNLYDVSLRDSTLTEFTKNYTAVDMWERLKIAA